MRSVRVHWVVGLKQKQWLAEEVFQNILHIQTYNWTKYALCECTLSGGPQAEAMAFRRNFSKHYTHSNIQLNKVCALWKYTDWWASSRSNGFHKKFFKTFYTFKHTIEQSMRSVKVQWVVGFKQKQRLAEEVFQNIIHIQTYTNEQSMRSVKVHWVVGFKQKQWLPEEVFQNILHIQTYNWRKYALCESTVSDGLQSEAMAFGRSFSKHYTHSNIQSNKVCSVKVHWVAGLKQKQWLSEKFFKTYTHSNIQLNKVCALWKYNEWWASSRSNGFQKKFFETLYTFKYTIEKSMRCVKVHWVVGFKQKQWLAEEIFQNIIHIQTYNWTKYALCESTLSGGLQAEAIAFRRSFSKHYRHSNKQLNKVCALWKSSEWWA